MEENNISPIDLVVVNLYPFVETISKENVTLEEAIEKIDIGGPSMIRSAAKNNKYVGVVVDPEDYPLVIKEMKSSKGSLSQQTRSSLATNAFTHTANYDTAISGYLLSLNKEDFTAFSSIFGLTEENNIFDFSSSAFRTSEEDANISSPLISKSLYGFVDKKCFVSLYLLTLYFLVYIFYVFCSLFLYLLKYIFNFILMNVFWNNYFTFYAK